MANFIVTDNAQGLYVMYSPERGKYGAYRDLQAEVLASYFDLTQPAEVANSAGKIAKRHVEDMTDAEKQEPMSTFRRLVVPRLRYLSDEPEAVEDAAEAEESQDSTSGGQKTLRRHHRVALHRRTLPEGWSASPEALKRALDQGIDLAPNETVVKAHGRGSKKVGEVVAHQLVRRQ